MIHSKIAPSIERYEQYQRGKLTRYTREEVEAAYSALQAAQVELAAACDAADAVLAPQRQDMGLWTEIRDPRYHALEALVIADLPVAQIGASTYGNREIYPVTTWHRVAAAWRAHARKMQREIARLLQIPMSEPGA